MREVGYEFAYMFKYSERPGTFAHEHLPDDVPDEVKSRRLSEIIALQNELGHASNLRDVGREFEVLVEGRSKRDEKQLSGRTSQNKVVSSTAAGTTSATMCACVLRGAPRRRCSEKKSFKDIIN